MALIFIGADFAAVVSGRRLFARFSCFPLCLNLIVHRKPLMREGANHYSISRCSYRHTSFLIAYGQVDDLEVQLIGTEQQIEIPEGIEIPKVLPVGLQLQVVFSEHHLGAAEGVLDRLLHQPAEKQTEELIAQNIERTHAVLLQRIDQPASVDEFSFPGGNGTVEFGQLLRWNGQIGIEDHQYVSCGNVVACTNRIALSLPGC